MDGATTAHLPSDSNSGDEPTTSNDQEDSIIDVSRERWEILPFESTAPPDWLSVCRAGTLEELSTKFFSNEIEILRPGAGHMEDLERLQVTFPLPGFSGISFEKLKFLKELELCSAPPRPLALSMSGQFGSLYCLTKLSICRFSIRYRLYAMDSSYTFSAVKFVFLVLTCAS